MSKYENVATSRQRTRTSQTQVAWGTRRHVRRRPDGPGPRKTAAGVKRLSLCAECSHNRLSSVPVKSQEDEANGQPQRATNYKRRAKSPSLSLVTARSTIMRAMPTVGSLSLVSTIRAKLGRMWTPRQSQETRRSFHRGGSEVSNNWTACFGFVHVGCR
jgi:hypothetical protein